MPFRWPDGFGRVPPEDWVEAPVDSLAVRYDKVEHHGWYSNLDPTVDEVQAFVQTGDMVVDYSGGTGIFLGRLLERLPRLAFGIVDVDASPKFLRVALEKFGSEERLAFRHLRYLQEQRRLQHLEEVLGPLVRRGVEAIVSTNAIHLYTDLPGTLRGWARCLKTGGRVFVQSGNIRPPLSFQGRWIIDDTVDALVKAAVQIVRAEDRFQPYRAVLDDPDAMAAHAAFRRRVFVPPRSLDWYATELYAAGFELLAVRTLPVEAQVSEWLEFLRVYHDGILGWIGGSEKVEGKPPSEGAMADRMELMQRAIEQVFQGRPSFQATWTYMTCAKRATTA